MTFHSKPVGGDGPGIVRQPSTCTHVVLGKCEPFGSPSSDYLTCSCPRIMWAASPAPLPLISSSYQPYSNDFSVWRRVTEKMTHRVEGPTDLVSVFMWRFLIGPEGRIKAIPGQWQIEFRMLFLNLLSGQTCCFDPHNASQELSVILKYPECNLWLLRL